jgi:hemerythrin superfamily protein
MMNEITRLEAPIDVMFLMHKAFHELSTRAEKLAAEGEKGGDLTEFRKTFDLWVKQFLYHADTEDEYMTAPLTDNQMARDNEAEHAELKEHGKQIYGYLGKGDTAGLEENVKAAMMALEEKQHEQLLDKVHEVEEILKQEMGEDRVVARTRCHLYRQVMAMRILEFDHFENEEAFICPVIREWDDEKQLELTKRLLIDDNAENPRWIIDWVDAELKPSERKLLSELEARFQ